MTDSNDNKNQKNPERKVTIIPAKPVEIQRDYQAKPLRVAAYCRVSTDSDEQLSSYKSQIEYYTHKIQENPNWKFAGIFADEGISGTSTKNREQFKKMITKCRKGRIDLILTKSLSRFSRNTADCIKYVRDLKALGIGVIFEKENLNTLTMDDEALLTIFSALAQAESESLSKNVRMGFQQKFKEGNVLFQRILGYRKDSKGNPEIIPEEAAVVKKIFNRYLDGLSVPAIKKELEAEGILTLQGKSTWSVGVLQYILRNERYIGDAVLQKTYITDPLTRKSKKNYNTFPKYYIENNHAPIIDKDVFNKVQEEISRRICKRNPSKKSKTGMSKYSGKYALNEKLVCRYCGFRYRRTMWSIKDESFGVWRCTNRMDNGSKYCNKSESVYESKTHEAIMQGLNQVISKEVLAEALKESVRALDNPGAELYEEIRMMLDNLPDLSKYDDKYTRQLLEVIKVMDSDRLYIAFKDGVEIEVVHALNRKAEQ